MTEVKNFNIQSKFKTLELVSFSVENRGDDQKAIDPLKITYEMSVNYNINQDKKILALNCLIKIFGDSKKSIPLGSIETKAEFEILNLDEIKDKDKVPMSMMAIFVGLLISSTRGMLTILSKGTSFEQGIIPIINPMDFFKNNIQPKTTGRTPDLKARGK